jgi:hypothetical protein
MKVNNFWKTFYDGRQRAFRKAGNADKILGTALIAGAFTNIYAGYGRFADLQQCP